MKQLTVKEIVEETVAYYSEDPEGRRGLIPESNDCFYLTEDGKMCAVGRCLLDIYHAIGSTLNVRCTVGSLPWRLNEFHQPLDNFLKPPYRGHPLNFWENLQGLHDNSGNWDSKLGITPAGRAFADEIIEEFDTTTEAV